MRLREYERIFKDGAIPPRGSVTGLVGRIIRRKKGDPWEMIDDADRRVAFLIDGGGLEKMPGQTWYQMLINVGWDAPYIQQKIGVENCEVALVVMPECAAALGTWDNVIDLMIAEYGPEIGTKLETHRAALRSMTPADLPAVEARMGFKFKDVNKGPDPKSDLRYMTPARYRDIRGNGTVDQARAFCYFSAHLRELYYGDGWTRNNQGQRGVEEFIVAGRRGQLHYLGEHLLIEGNVILPGAGGSAKRIAYGLPMPAHYDPRNAESWAFTPNQTDVFDAASAWRKQHGIRPAASDSTNVHLLLIDVQKDFCFPQGSLFVAGRSGTGAIDDNRRIAEMIYANIGRITSITKTMDTHFAFQIFFPSFWVDANGEPLKPHREITVVQIDSGEVSPNQAVTKWLCNGNYTWLKRQVRDYCERLEKAGKYKLYLWPPHCILGSDGHALAGIIHEAQMFHAFARGAQSWVEVKGGNTLTENYSVMQPEVLTRHDGEPLAQKNTLFLRTLLSADAVIIAGQAASHCVKSSIDDILAEITATDSALAKKIYLMADCMSSVTVPDGKGGFVADFTPQAETALKRFADAGMNVVKSTTDPSTWPYWPGH